MAHQEAPGAGELVGLARDDPHDQFLAEEVSPGQLERLNQIRLVDIDGGARGLGVPGFELVDAVFTALGVARLSQRNVVGRSASRTWR